MMGFLKLIVGFITRILFRVKVNGLENYHQAGDRTLIVANHTSLLDGFFLYLFLPDRPTFAINTKIAKLWYFRPVLKAVELFVMDPHNPLSTKALIRYLTEGRKAIIFPEGRITTTGALMKIYEGPGMIADKANATVLPIGIEGAQFSHLSYLKGIMRRVCFPQITINILPPRRIDLQDDMRGSDRRKAAGQRLSDIMHEVALANCGYDSTVFQKLLEAMSRHGNKHPVAEDHRRQPLTFRQLVARSFILGEAISRQTRTGENVGVLLPNVLTNLVTLLGLLSHGRVAAMLNFTAGEKGLTLACETAQIRTVFTSRQFVEEAGLESAVSVLAKQNNIVYLEDTGETISRMAKIRGLIAAWCPHWHYRRLAPQLAPDDPAIILFTSGSEGIPKGVVLSHRNLLANRAQIRTHIDFTPHDVLFNALPMFHAFGLTGGTLLPILDGARVFLYPSPLHYRIIPELCYEMGATVLLSTNTFLAAYARYAHPYDFHAMRYVVSGAEKLQAETRRIWSEKLGVRVFEGYGATEASPVISTNTPMENKTGSVGRILTGIDYYIEPIEGIENGGQLIISGPNIMTGYLFHGNDGQPVQPSTDRGQGWYDTGDIVSIDDDGFISIIGRARRFAKIGGEMVSLTLIEELAASVWPNACHAAATLPDLKKGEQIVLLTDYKSAVRKDMVAEFKNRGFPEIMIPRKIMISESVPLLGSGKTDYPAVNRIVRENDE